MSFESAPASPPPPPPPPSTFGPSSANRTLGIADTFKRCWGAVSGLTALAGIAAFAGFFLFLSIALSPALGGDRFGSDRPGGANLIGVVFGFLCLLAGYFVAIGLYMGAVMLSLRTSLGQSVGFGEAAIDGLRVVWHSAIVIPGVIVLAIITNIASEVSGGLSAILNIVGAVLLGTLAIVATGVGMRKALDGHILP
jgi:hypothetical protein